MDWSCAMTAWFSCQMILLMLAIVAWNLSCPPPDMCGLPIFACLKKFLILLDAIYAVGTFTCVGISILSFGACAIGGLVVVRPGCCVHLLCVPEADEPDGSMFISYGLFGEVNDLILILVAMFMVLVVAICLSITRTSVELSVRTRSVVLC